MTIGFLLFKTVDCLLAGLSHVTYLFVVLVCIRVDVIYVRHKV
jgi:hypothetical protein